MFNFFSTKFDHAKKPNKTKQKQLNKRYKICFNAVGNTLADRIGMMIIQFS